MIKKFWKKCLTAPTNVLRFVVLTFCIIIAIYQLAECFEKLRNPPISTYSSIVYNESMVYPAVTICRNPSYKTDVLKEHGLSDDITHSSEWYNFPWGNKSLDDFWNEATFALNESILVFGLNYEYKNIAVTSTMHLDNGRCFTFHPLVTTSQVRQEVGMIIILTHHLAPYYLTGWNIYVHDKDITWTENPQQTDGLLEYTFLGIGEELHLKLSAHHKKSIPHDDFNCEVELPISYTECGERCRWTMDVVPAANCTAPWLPGIDLPLCSNATEFNELMAAYRQYTKYDPSICNCVQPCIQNLYNTYVDNRRTLTLSGRDAINNISLEMATPEFNLTYTNTYIQQMSILSVYFNSKMVQTMEDKYGYDLNLFTSDLGGSLGFLLGLSVLSFIGLLEHMLTLIKSIAKSKRREWVVDYNSDSSSFKQFEDKKTDRLPGEKY